MTGRAEVWTSGVNPVDVAEEVRAVLVKHNIPPALFRMGPDAAALLVADGTLEPYDSDRWLYHTAGLVDFLAAAKDGAKIVGPPHHAMRMVPTATIRHLPPLDGVVHTPYLDTDGKVVDTDGYNPATRLFLLGGNVELPPVPSAPTAAELAAAVKLLTVEWLGDFPFDCDASRANMIALVITLTGRAFFSLAPLTVIDASTSGSGKNLLVSTASIIHDGRRPHLLELPADGEEQRKKVTTALLQSNDLIVWDESPVIAGRTLAMILTAEIYSDRLLGGNKMISVRNRFTQVALGNNVQVWGDLKRRVVPVRLVPEHEHPEHRCDFRHSNLDRWVSSNRGRLLAAVLTIWRAWIAEGKPRGQVTMGSFERWATAVGGALDVAGIKGFLSTTAGWLGDSDPDDGGWGEHLADLVEIFGTAPFTVKDVVFYFERGKLELPYLKRNPDRSMAHAVGNGYRSVRDRWIGKYRLTASETLNSSNGARSWTVTPRSQESQ